ncbi:Tat pathway signal protein [Rhodobacterales bacterium 52_120_T64]|nr:Tat pathway signal protein [Rhodobacterales bacterium 52_120_T64]
MKFNDVGTSRRQLLGAFAGVAVISAAPVYASAAGFLRNAGDVRRISMNNKRTGESIDTIYWIEGKYITPALNEISYFMRDWRRDEVIGYDRRNIDILAASHRLMETTEPYTLLSGYRSPQTNAMLRSSNGGVASNSYHMRGMAADVRLASRSVSQMTAAGKACNSGGVGKYNRSNFVHMDCGPIRSWRG